MFFLYKNLQKFKEINIYTGKIQIYYFSLKFIVILIAHFRGVETPTQNIYLFYDKEHIY
jgi:hypothetical protein